MESRTLSEALSDIVKARAASLGGLGLAYEERRRNCTDEESLPLLLERREHSSLLGLFQFDLIEPGV